MPHLRLSQLAAVAFLIAALFLPGFADLQHYVTDVNSLTKLSTEIQNSPDSGIHSILFDKYGEVGNFRIDSPTTKVTSLTFRRRFSDSEAVIKVTGTLLEIKNMKAKVLLKGLAFQLMPNAVLISGADGAKVNGSLLIDSCFIFADTLENTFLSWLGDNLSSVEIRNSYIVVGGSKTAAAKISLSGGTLKLNNNLINFSGTISSPGGVFKEAQFISNTINRTQFQLTGMFDSGVLPSVEFTKNLIAHRGPKDAFGGTVYYVLNHSNFDPSRVFIQYNKMFNTWNGFDYPLGAKFKENTNNVLIDTIPGKPSSEKWNWYTESLDNNETGLLSGTIKNEKYNVLPSDSSFSWALPLPRGNLKVEFRPALYPRQIRLDTGVAPVILPSDTAFYRRVFPGAGVVHFGPFNVDRITMGASADYGSPVLLALDSLNFAQNQPAGPSVYKSNPSVYRNGFGSARKFILVNYGNTPKGSDIRPGEGSELSAKDKLLFSKVDSAGYTVVLAPLAQNLAKNLRSLEASLRVNTNAVINSLVHIGVKEEVKPYSGDKVYWLFRNPSDTLISAEKSVTMPDSGKYTASFQFSSSRGMLDAFLVELLSIPSGGKSIALSDGSIKVVSIGGFQLTVDSLYVVDRELYGSPTKGYSFTWPEKSPNDSIEITLKADSSQKMFVRLANGTIDSVPNARRTETTLSYGILDADKGKTFFTAMEYNIQKSRFYDNVTYDGVNVTGFRSSISGKLGFEALSGENQKSLGAAVRDFRLLGGTQMKAVSIATLHPDTVYRLEFTPNKNSLNPAMVEAYFNNGQSWSIVPVPVVTVPGVPGQDKYMISQVPASAKAIAVVERLEAAEKYVKIDTAVVGLKLSMNTSYVIASITHITHYCVELQWVNGSGSLETEYCQNTDKKAIGQATDKSLQPNSAYQIRIIYYMGEEEINGRKFGLLPGTSFSVMAAAEPDSVKLKPKSIWHLVGFPVSGPFSKFMHRSEVKEDAKDSNQTVIMRFRKHAQGDTSKAVFDTIPDWNTMNVKPGDAYLLASSRPFDTKVSADDSALALKPHILTLDTGWILVSNPFPITQVRSKIVSSGPNDRSFYRLNYLTRPDGRRSYFWTPDSVLRPFFGYAYYAKKNESLTFNPLMGAAAKTGQGTGQTEDFEARLDAPWGLSAMSLTASPGRSSVPFLPVPGQGLQLRVGGGNGYMVKTLSSADRIDEPVEIISPASGRGSFTFSRLFRTGMAMRLVDLESGAVHDEAGARDLPITEGSHAFRLIAGDEAFVQARVQAFQAAAPAEISMSQNYPNPFRGRTNVELRWPAWQGIARKAVLDVIDMHGRLLQRVDLGEVRMGRQVVTLDSRNWRTGVYLYRLTVAAGGRRIQIQKRMLVTP